MLQQAPPSRAQRQLPLNTTTWHSQPTHLGSYDLLQVAVRLLPPSHLRSRAASRALQEGAAHASWTAPACMQQHWRAMAPLPGACPPTWHSGFVQPTQRKMSAGDGGVRVLMGTSWPMGTWEV